MKTFAPADPSLQRGEVALTQGARTLHAPEVTYVLAGDGSQLGDVAATGPGRIQSEEGAQRFSANWQGQLLLEPVSHYYCLLLHVEALERGEGGSGEQS